jgi:hypothetical protein
VLAKPFTEDLGPYWLNDSPVEPFAVDFLDSTGQVTQRPADALAATLAGPDGTTGGAVLSVTVDLDVDFVTVNWVTPPTLNLAGIWSLTLTPTDPAGTRFAPLRFVVQDDDGWTTIDDAREDWADAPAADATLFRLLEAARTACITFAPALYAGDPIPTGYRLAQLMQARAIWNSTKAGAQDSFGPDGLTVTVFPLDWNIKALLRPKRGKTVIR